MPRRTATPASARRPRPSHENATSHEPVQAAVAVEPGEPRQTLPVAKPAGLGPEGFDMVAHHLIQRALSGAAGCVRRRGDRHARPARGRRASCRSRGTGPTSSYLSANGADLASPLGRLVRLRRWLLLLVELAYSSVRVRRGPASRVTPAMEARITDHVWSIDDPGSIGR